jgi:hypothetical protein
VVAASKPNKWRKLKNVRREAGRTFNNKKREYLKKLISFKQTVRINI